VKYFKLCRYVLQNTVSSPFFCTPGVQNNSRIRGKRASRRYNQIKYAVNATFWVFQHFTKKVFKHFLKKFEQIWITQLAKYKAATIPVRTYAAIPSNPAIISYTKNRLMPIIANDIIGPVIVQNRPVRNSPITVGIAQKWRTGINAKGNNIDWRTFNIIFMWVKCWVIFLGATQETSQFGEPISAKIFGFYTEERYDELHISLMRMNLEICKHSSFLIIEKIFI